MTSNQQRIVELEKQCDKLAKCLGTLIGWSARELGHDNVIKLLDMLPPKDARNRGDSNE